MELADEHSKRFKVQVNCPIESVDEIRLAIGDAGGGRIGKYSHCAFVSTGTGYFLPLEGADPAIGTVGEITQVQEAKIEFVCTEDTLKAIVAAIQEVHPYEEVPIEVHPLTHHL